MERIGESCETGHNGRERTPIQAHLRSIRSSQRSGFRPAGSATRRHKEQSIALAGIDNQSRKAEMEAIKQVEGWAGWMWNILRLGGGRCRGAPFDPRALDRSGRSLA